MTTTSKRNYVTSVSTQTEVVSSPILWQCLFVIRTVPEFQNLAYRVTKTVSGPEVLVVYREGVSGIFGPPVDPITLTLESSGKCLLAILFKPIQRVSIVDAESGRIEIGSLMTVLRMVAGKDFLFCPGLPEKFVSGKACGRFVVLLRVPFKRYQSSQCPVYYQPPVFQQTSTKSLFALCPKCMQVAKWIQGMSVYAPTSSAALVRQKEPTQRVVRVASHDSSGDSVIASYENGTLATNTVVPTSITKLLTLANEYGGRVTSLQGKTRVVKVNLNNSNVSGPLPAPAINGKGVSQRQDTSLPVKTEGKEPSVKEKVQAASMSLKHMLQEKYRKKTLSIPDDDSWTYTEDMNDVEKSEKESRGPSSNASSKGKKPKSNTCRLCKKQFSTPASLLNHLQRHEGLSGRRQKQSKKYKTQETSSAVLRMIVRGSKSRLALSNRKSSKLSATSLRMVLKCLDDMIHSQNGAKSLEQEAVPDLLDNMSISDTSARDRKQVKNQAHNASKETSSKNSENSSRRPGVKRSGSGLSAVQTLLEAAALTGNSPDDVSTPTVMSSTASKQHEANSIVASSSNHPTEQPSPPGKRPRKSPRLASKRARKAKNKNSSHETAMSGSAATTTDSSMLTNLNLLSTVSLEKALQEKPESPVTQTPKSTSASISVLSSRGSSSIETKSVLSFPRSHATAVTTSQSVSVFLPLPTKKAGADAQENQSYSKLPSVPQVLHSASLEDVGQKHTFGKTQRVSGPPQLVPLQSLSTSKRVVTVSPTQPAVSLSMSHAGQERKSSSGDCGAIDLSKPKAFMTSPNIPSILEKGLDLSSFAELPHNFAQLVAGNDNPQEMLQCLIKMTKAGSTSAPAAKKNIQDTISSKQADSNLQARMFASAREYKIAKSVQHSPQVQAVIASTSRIAQPGNVAKGISSGDEIQCGYKWSGSGGMVKERTQMVRELVSSDVMASFLSKPRLPGGVTSLPPAPTSTAAPMFSSPRRPVPQANARSQDILVPQHALNLTTNASRLTDAPSPKKGGRGRKTMSPSTSAPTWSQPSPNFSSQPSILRSSLLSSSTPQEKADLLSTSGGTTTTPSLHRTRSKSSSSGLSSSSPKSLSSPASSTPTPPSNCSISSPSLAAMLRQPATVIHEVNHNDVLNSTIRSISSPTAAATTGLTLPGGVQIKTEPEETYTPEYVAERIIMSLPIKTEMNTSSESCRDQSRSPARLVMDITEDSTAGKKDNSMTVSVSRAENIESGKAKVKCEL